MKGKTLYTLSIGILVLIIGLLTFLFYFRLQLQNLGGNDFVEGIRKQGIITLYTWETGRDREFLVLVRRLKDCKSEDCIKLSIIDEKISTVFEKTFNRIRRIQSSDILRNLTTQLVVIGESSGAGNNNIIDILD